MQITLKPVEPKDPGESKLYTMDWSGKLPSGVTISTSTWSFAPSGLTNAADAIVTGNLKTSVRVSGGVDDNWYDCTNTVVLSDSQTLVAVGQLKVEKKRGAQL
jgi:hypothetical protein